jgi:hypothetical protein
MPEPFLTAAAEEVDGFFLAAEVFAPDFFFAEPVFAEGFRAVVDDFAVFADGFFFRPLPRAAVFDVLVLPAPAAEEVFFVLRFFEGDFLADAEDFFLVGDFLFAEAFFALLFFPAIEPFSLCLT